METTVCSGQCSRRQPNFAALNRPVQNQQTTETYVLRKDLDELVTADLKTEKME